MILTTARSIIFFSGLVLLSSSDVLARPVQNTNSNVYNPAARSLSRRSDGELLAALLMRRGRSRSGSNASAGGSQPAATHLIEVCSGRDGSPDSDSSLEEDKSLHDLDPENKFVVTAPITAIGSPIGAGSQAQVCTDPTDATALIKHFDSSVSSFTPGQLYKEKKYLQKAGHFKNKFHYMTKPSKFAAGKPQLTQAWIWIKKVEGKGLSDLGLLPAPHSADKPETSEFAKAHPVGSAPRKAFIEKLITMITAKALEYAKELGVHHLDVSDVNVRIVMNGNDIVSVDLIDWGMAKTTKCNAAAQAKIHQAVHDAFSKYF